MARFISKSGDKFEIRLNHSGDTITLRNNQSVLLDNVMGAGVSMRAEREMVHFKIEIPEQSGALRWTVSNSNDGIAVAGLPVEANSAESLEALMAQVRSASQERL